MTRPAQIGTSEMEWPTMSYGSFDYESLGFADWTDVAMFPEDWLSQGQLAILMALLAYDTDTPLEDIERRGLDVWLQIQDPRYGCTWIEFPEVYATLHRAYDAVVLTELAAQGRADPREE